MYNHSTIDAKQCIETMADRLQARQISTWDCPHCDKVPHTALQASHTCQKDSHQAGNHACLAAQRHKGQKKTKEADESLTK